MNIELAFSKEAVTTQLTVMYISTYAYAGLIFSKVHVFENSKTQPFFAEGREVC